MPFAQHHYPFENKELFEAAVPGRLHLRGGGPDPRLVLFPAGDLHPDLQQGALQERASCWATCRMRTGRRCPSPRATPSIRSTRWKATAPTPSAGTSTPTPRRGCPTASTTRRCVEGQRKFLGTLWNTYAFYVLYADIDQFDPTKHTLDRDTAVGHGPAGCSPSSTPRSRRRMDRTSPTYKIPEAAQALCRLRG